MTDTDSQLKWWIDERLDHEIHSEYWNDSGINTERQLKHQLPTVVYILTDIAPIFIPWFISLAHDT